MTPKIPSRQHQHTRRHSIQLKKLIALSDLHAEIIDTSETQMQAIDAAEETLPSPEEINNEAKRLCSTFLRDYDGNTMLERAEAATFMQELSNLCELQETSDVLCDGGKYHEDIDVKSELECAWNCDQLAILSARTRKLDAVCGVSSLAAIPLTHAHCRRRSISTSIFSLKFGAFVTTLKNLTNSVVKLKHLLVHWLRSLRN